MKKIAELRKEYSNEELDISQVEGDPIKQFRKWFGEALNADLLEPNAMVLATSTSDGKPCARTVLLKGLEYGGFVFYTNYNSRKGRELMDNPNATLLFVWLELERQIRIEGKVEKLPEEASIAYFRSRPKGSQIGAWASEQSEVISGRQVLEEKVVKLSEEYASEEHLPKPVHWGGFVVIPSEFEFWQGRPSRLHDRIRYQQTNKGTWKIDRLSP